MGELLEATAHPVQRKNGAALLLLTAERRPITHHPTAFVEEVATPIRRFHLVADGVRQGHFGSISRVVGTLARPITERRAEAVSSDHRRAPFDLIRTPGLP